MNVSAEMPRYKSHKEVHALKIRGLQDMLNGILLDFAEEGYAAMEIEQPDASRIRQAWFDYNMESMSFDYGYLVVYADGYRSWSPTKAFEDGYIRM